MSRKFGEWASASSLFRQATDDKSLTTLPARWSPTAITMSATGQPCRVLCVAACHAATRRHVSSVGHARSGLLSCLVCCRVASCYRAMYAGGDPLSAARRLPSAVRGHRVGGGLRRSIGCAVVVASCGSTCIPAGAKLSNLRRASGQRKDVSCRKPPSWTPAAPTGSDGVFSFWKQARKQASPGRGCVPPTCGLYACQLHMPRAASASVWCCCCCVSFRASARNRSPAGQATV